MDAEKVVWRPKVIYIAGPFRGPTHWDMHLNALEAEEVALEVWKLGGVAICPHKNTENFQGQLPDWVWLEGDLEIVRRCDAVFVLQGWQQSDGTKSEVAFAQSLGLPVLFRWDDLERFLDGSWLEDDVSQPFEETWCDCEKGCPNGSCE